jgi:hypothetical protein
MGCSNVRRSIPSLEALEDRCLLSIIPAQLTITAVPNVELYDGTTSAAAIPIVQGLVGGDTVTGLSEAYSNSSPGQGKTLIVTGYVVNDGNNGQNYSVVTVPCTAGVIASPLNATHFQVSAPATATVGVPVSLTVTALDQNGNPAGAYTGTVHFSSTDSLAILPADMTLSRGMGTISAVFNIIGSQTITATDSMSANIVGTSGPVVVVPATTPPSNWGAAAGMPAPRASQTATLLDNGKVLITGGNAAGNEPSVELALATSLLYDPPSNTWSSAASMSLPLVTPAPCTLPAATPTPACRRTPRNVQRDAQHRRQPDRHGVGPGQHQHAAAHHRHQRRHHHPWLGGHRDVTLVGNTVGPLTGTLYVDSSDKSVTFKATEASLFAFQGTYVLPNDTYTVTAVSAQPTASGTGQRPWTARATRATPTTRPRSWSTLPPAGKS